jgi:hypothetical protein
MGNPRSPATARTLPGLLKKASISLFFQVLVSKKLNLKKNTSIIPKILENKTTYDPDLILLICGKENPQENSRVVQNA